MLRLSLVQAFEDYKMLTPIIQIQYMASARIRVYEHHRSFSDANEESQVTSY